jgi:hypothetical protein
VVLERGMPTFTIIPAHFSCGTIQVDILSRLNGKGPADARAFAGIAYWIANDGDRGNEPKAAAAAGPVGLFVDIGTEAYFPNLRIKPAE